MARSSKTSTCLALSGLLVLSACAAGVEQQAGPRQSTRTVLGDQQDTGRRATDTATGDTQSTTAEPTSEVITGTGVFVGEPGQRSTQILDTDGGIVLNFVRTDIAEVVAAVLGDSLGRNYVIDPEVTGTITIQTSRPLARNALLPTLETALRLNNVAMVQSNGVFKIVPSAKANTLGVSARSRATPGGEGFRLLVAPLTYVAAAEMREILEPVALSENILRVDDARNILILSGTQDELNAIEDLIDIFDVDWLDGMSFGLFRLRFTDPQSVIETLEQVFVETGAGARVAQFVPIERLNTVLVISPQPAMVDRVGDWIERLDRGVGGSERRAFVYRVQNSRAENLAAALQQVFADDGPDTTRPNVTDLISIDTVPTAAAADDAAIADGTPPPVVRAVAGDGIALPASANIRIIADTEHNAIIVVASPQDYRMIQATIRELDVVPLQVLIQATLIEVSLTDSLNFGVRYFLERDGGRQISQINQLPGLTGAFSFAFSRSNFQATIEALSAITDIKVVSSPELMVLDNQTAELQVGDQVPVSTRSSTSVTDPDAPVVNEIEFRDTGVILRVTPPPASMPAAWSRWTSSRKSATCRPRAPR